MVSAAYTASVGGGDGFSIGNACSAELVIVLADAGTTAGNQSLRVTWDVAGTEYPLFTGTVSKATTSGSQTTITAYDALDSVSSTPYEPTLTGSCTATEALADIAAQMGVELDGDTKTLASGTALTEGVTALEGLSLSNAAANIALLLGGNAIITRAGALAVRQFTDCGWETESYAGGATPEDTAYTVDGLTFQRTDTTTATDEDGITTESSTSTDYTASASSGAGLTYSTNLATQALVDGAYEALAGLSFRAGSFSVQGGLFVEPGDLVTVDGLTVAVSSISLSLDGGCKTTITSLGQSDTSSTGGSITQAISAIQQDYAEFKTMVADNISATNANFTNVLANYIKTDELEATVATFGYVTADSAVITDLTAEVANINSVLAGNVGAGTVQTVHLTSENVVIDDAVITDAMIVNLTASKLTAGTIYTSLVTIQTAEGDRSLYMTDALIAMYDSNDTQRLQAGMAYENEGYNFVIWDENGTELFNATGITASGIPSETIVNDHVAEDAAISGTKLDISSVASELNKDGSLTVNAAQITIDDTTLEYRLTSMTTATNEAAAAAQAAQDMAEALESEAVSSLTQYYAVGDSADEPPSDPATNSSTWVEDFPSVEDGEYLWTAFYVVYADESSEWTTPTCLTDGVAREAVSALQTELEVVQGKITAKVWQTDIDTAVSGISVGGRNYLLNTRTFDGWSRASNVTLEEDDEGYTVATWAATTTLAYNGVSSRDPIPFSLVRGQTVTLSFDIRSDDFDSSDTSSTNRVQISFALCEADSTTRTLSRDVTVSRMSVTTEWVRYTLTATLTDDYFTSGSGDIDDTTRFYIIVYNYALTSLQIRKVKLELGSVATDWTPAPEDTEASITTLTDKYASLTLTIDGITTEVADVETAVTESYETLSERIATVEQTADGITSTVSNVQSQLNNLTVGGRNYLLNTRTFNGWSRASNVTLEEDDEGYTVATWAATSTLAYNGVSSRDPIQFSLVRGQTVTLSFDIRSDDFDSSNTSSTNSIQISLALCEADSTTRTLRRDVTVSRTSVTTEWTRYTLTATLTDDYFTSGSGDIDDTTRFYIIVYNYTLTSLQIRKVKLELGSVATDWSPAPEDSENAITSAATALSSQITQTASEITDTVSALETTVSDNYTTLSDQVTTVEETADSITSTVSALDAVVAGNYETLSNRIATVEQTADGITSTVSNVQTQLNNLTVGGRNYLLNTRTFDGWTKSSNVTLEEDDEGYTVATWAATDTLAYNYIGRSPIQFSLIQDQTVTLSFDIRSDDFDSSDTSSTNRVSVSLALCTADSTTRALYRDVTVSRASITSDWVRYTITATLTDDYFTAGSGSIDDVSRFFVTFYNYALTSLQIRKVKLELGNIATDWSPAPEDSENTISYAMSKIQQLDTSIELCVTVDESSGYLRLGTGDDSTVKFTIDADNITLDEDGNVTIAGTITATGGTVGGWNISSQKIYGTAADGTTTAVMQISGLTEGTAYVFAAGGTSHSSYADSPFRVNKLGQVWADRLISATYLAAGNDYGLYCLDTSGTGQRIAYLSNNDNVVLGHSDYATYINGSTVTVSANLTASGTVFVPNSGIALANGYGVHHYLSSGSYSKFEYVNASNQFLVGNSSYATYLYGSSITSSKSIATSSDRRLKEDIHPLDRPGLVDALVPVSYRLRDDPALVHYGFVAQDVEEALAELDIHSSALVQTDAATGMKSIAYAELIPLLVAEIQKLKQTVDNLQKEACK